ncbi:methyltransferase family protein [Chitinophaga qingshengii]|uniref:Isoprenylcysteine carboxylmethyltransferase family protein n=1 Tax=Chitinophaga qingshengii TaxID=1569794 RepID=A0ABR7THX8_9BACT|nr:isoprenylcysteine carboxylmethyltransferase family protein [Chitinophaga qingshengii]MBC9929111.1 isoprenylcysteine carboxylmethyltransferase family protein [Chitinophaga qingshengii]
MFKESPTLFTWVTCNCWLVFGCCWLTLRNRTKENVQLRTTRQRWMGFIGYCVIFVSLYLPLFTGTRLLPALSALQAAGALLCIGGIALCIWSRLLLGTNWSGGVAAKKDHELIVKGPYRLIRHPIYTGFITALAGTSLVSGGSAALIATLVCAMALYLKIEQEETLLNELFPGTYAAYQQQTRKLIPFIL